MYETRLFNEKKRNTVYNNKGVIRKDVLKIEHFHKYDGEMELEIKTKLYAESKKISTFKINGNFNLAFKKAKTIIECLSNVVIQNEIFGEFKLEKGMLYQFNLETVGRDPKLKRNNLFISKYRIYQLLFKNKILQPDILIKKIAAKI